MIDILALKEQIHVCKSRIKLYEEVLSAFHKYYDYQTLDDNEMHFNAITSKINAETLLVSLECKLEVFSKKD